jgi:hypothetical protein
MNCFGGTQSQSPRTAQIGTFEIDVDSFSSACLDLLLLVFARFVVIGAIIFKVK